MLGGLTVLGRRHVEPVRREGPAVQWGGSRLHVDEHRCSVGLDAHAGDRRRLFLTKTATPIKATTTPVNALLLPLALVLPRGAVVVVRVDRASADRPQAVSGRARLGITP